MNNKLKYCFSEKIKKFTGVMLAATFICLSGTHIALAMHPYGEYDFDLDFSSGDPYAYSKSVEKWSKEDALVASNASSEYDFTATVLRDRYSGSSQHTNVVIYPGKSEYISVPWFNSKSTSAVLRGKSNYDIWYNVYGAWTTQPSYNYPQD